MSRQFFAQALYDGQRWLADVAIAVDADGVITSVESGAPSGAAHRLPGPVIPGMPNLHSHAFQRVMAGLAEYQTHPDDSFWTWRETMYRIAGRLEPDQQAVIARQLYLEMLKAGYTTVCEFHYLHNDPEGHLYDDPARCAKAVRNAAAEVGIGMTMLPVLYQFGGFGSRPLEGTQLRFRLGTDQYLGILQSLIAEDSATARTGIAFHSLRAVDGGTIRRVLEEVPADVPVHIHIAEQRPEVEQALSHLGDRPVRWLFDQAEVDARWCLVHATHLDEEEVALLADSGAVAGLCPTTEANLGDGLFPLPAYLQAGGRWGIGSDSHISVSPVEELRWLEYGQRLVAERRNRVADEKNTHCGARLWGEALTGGAAASGRPVGKLQTGYRADWVVLDGQSANLFGRDGDLLLDSLVFAGNSQPVRDVYVGGEAVIRDGRHPDEERIESAYREVASLLR